jgi:hypothetical protein
VKEYDVFIPLYDNDGSPIEPAKFQRLRSRLLEKFEGLTSFPQPNQGFWRFGDLTYRDEIVIFRVISGNPSGSRAFLAELKKDLKEEFRQEEILIIEPKLGFCKTISADISGANTPVVAMVEFCKVWPWQPRSSRRI